MDFLQRFLSSHVHKEFPGKIKMYPPKRLHNIHFPSNFSQWGIVGNWKGNKMEILENLKHIGV